MPATRTEDELAYVRQGLGDPRNARSPRTPRINLDTILVFNLLRTHSLLSPFLDADLRCLELTAAQFNVLLVLRAAGKDGLVMRDIGRKLVVAKSNVTGLIDRLERQELARRTEHRDRRVTVVRLTSTGAQLLQRAARRQAALVGRLGQCLTDREKRTLIRLLTRLRRELRGQRSTRRAGHQNGDRDQSHDRPRMTGVDSSRRAKNRLLMRAALTRSAQP